MNPRDDDAVPDDGRCALCQLTKSEIGSIEVCFGCGVVRLNIQAVSLRLEPEVFHALALMVGSAHDGLRRHAENVIAATTSAGKKAH